MIRIPGQINHDLSEQDKLQEDISGDQFSVTTVLLLEVV
jgi:hypothetical protein